MKHTESNSSSNADSNPSDAAPILRIVVIGGTGLIGKRVVGNLRKLGHDVVPASPSLGINAVTGEGLTEALKGANVVVDVSNSPSFADGPVMEFFDKSTRNLIAAEIAAGVGHHVALSVVGTERLQASGYFRAKLVQENLIKASPVPYTIVRATQFFEFVGGIAQSCTVGETVRATSALLQPIVAEDVSAYVTEIAVATPGNGTLELAGPDPIPLDSLIRQLFARQGDTREVITDDNAPYFGMVLNDQSLTPGANPRLAPTHYADWLSRNAAVAAR